MPIDDPDNRAPIHTRSIVCNGYRRDDGLWDIEAHLTDTKAYAVHNDFRSVPAGAPFHSMTLRITVDDTLTIHAIKACIDAAPQRICPAIVPNLQCLVGLQIGPGFNAELRRRLGGELGCTHLVELFSLLATTAIQTVLPLRRATSDGDPAHLNPIGGCHAFAANGALVARYWPQPPLPAAA
jgi:hypothetical protein